MRLHPVVVAALVACGGETNIGGFQQPPADPPGETIDEQGDPPDWQNCFTGWRGIYSNLTVDHPHVLPRPADEPPPTEVGELDWWERTAFEQFDPTLDHGQNWWPVDQGLEGDPAYFSVYWHAWIRAWSDTRLEFLMGSADDAWVVIDGETVASLPGIKDTFDRERFTVRLDAGQYPIEVFYAHRGSDNNGFSFRVLPESDVSICYPDFGQEENAE